MLDENAATDGNQANDQAIRGKVMKFGILEDAVEQHKTDITHYSCDNCGEYNDEQTAALNFTQIVQVQNYRAQNHGDR